MRGGRFARYVYLPYGPTGQDVAAAFSSVVASARERNLDFARVEPLVRPTSSALGDVAAVTAKPVQPRWTWVLDLSADESTLRQGLSSGHRGSINAAERRGLHVRSSRDPSEVELFCELQRKAAGGGRFRGQSPRYFRTIAGVLLPRRASALYFAEAEGRTLASAIAFDFARTRYYAHAVSDPVAGRKLGAAAPLVWQMILDARAGGMSLFDFWGVAPPRSEDHSWSGFSQFKRSFGGRLVEFPGAWEIPVRGARHRVFRAVRSLKR